MKIQKIFNNNVGLVINEKGEEIILAGKGLMFGMKKGDEISESRANKKFELIGNTRNRFEKMIQETPIDYILISEEIISYIKTHSTKKIDDGIYVTLTDHINNTITRIKKGIDFDSTMLLNVKTLYNEEYKLALHAVQMLRDEFSIHIDDTEANFITLHIVNAESESNMMQMYKITLIINQIIDIVKWHFDIQTEDNFDYDRFVTHCRFFVQRIANKEKHTVISPANKSMLKIMKEQYEKQYSCVEEILAFIEKKYAYKASEDEGMYLLLHLSKLTDKDD